MTQLTIITFLFFVAASFLALADNFDSDHPPGWFETRQSVQPVPPPPAGNVITTKKTTIETITQVPGFAVSRSHSRRHPSSPPRRHYKQHQQRPHHCFLFFCN